MKKSILLKQLLLLLFITAPAVLLSQNMEKLIDQIMNDQYQKENYGATVLVAKDGKVRYRKAFGKANVELDINMIPENVFEIGSITKQFTAVGILMLLEEGKLSLDDEITKFIPEYPTQGTKITIHHLLTHTSGIKSYTSIPSLREFARKDLKVTELIDAFKNEPMDFKPGEQYRYNNSGYVLLGYIIEKVSGMTYEDFIQKRFFDKLDMNTSHYGSKSKIIKNRAYGYQQSENGYANADYISMTIPYAAGSIMSTVDDLLKWNTAVQNHELISKKSLEKAFTNYTLNNGNKINYGYGWSLNSIKDVATIEHGGGIFGFTTQGIYVPSEDVYVIILTNCDCDSPTQTANKIAAIAIGKPYPKAMDAIKLSKEELKKWVGAYKFEDGTIRVITLKGNQLYSQRTDSSAEFKIFPLSQHRFFFEDSFSEFIFSDGKQKTAIFKSNTFESKGIETDAKLPEPKKEVQLSPTTLKKYIGNYQLAPNFFIEITVDGNQIFAQATGQSKFEMFAESEDNFFLKVVPASVTFQIDERTKMPKSLTLHQGGNSTVGKKVK
ncbi:serine hydrolase [Kordia algicida OT-1]|uniref:Beta-lactamase n=1 Tax=Kordia algicida OT-1 TaxID=391587 RepID=A9E325_9FLAO|nr:serine hydrolase [Kordia algicida]EDP95457.1 beta-lactamase [Kordia algicida OT-1]